MELGVLSLVFAIRVSVLSSRHVMPWTWPLSKSYNKVVMNPNQMFIAERLSAL